MSKVLNFRDKLAQKYGSLRWFFQRPPRKNKKLRRASYLITRSFWLIKI